MINVSELINDPDFTQPNGVNVIRTKYTISNHQLVPEESNLNFVGIITIADDTITDKTETADKNSEKIHVFTYQPLYVTGQPVGSEDTFLSDIVVFEGNQYSVDSVLNDSQYGFSRATCSKLRQDVM